MEFDRWTVLLLQRRDDAPARSAAESATLQDAHLAYLARLHDEGRLVAAGPVRASSLPKVAGICIYATDMEEAVRLGENDPAVRAGEFRIEVFSWFVPGGTVKFSPARFPRSSADVNRS